MSFLLTFLLLTSASTDMTEHFERYKKCYIHFLREKPVADDPLLLQLKAHKMTELEACDQLLSSADFDSAGHLKKDSPQALKILRTFQDFHRQWFPAYELNLGTTDFAATDFYDVNEMGYFVTFSFFGENFPFSEIATSSHSFSAVRSTSRKPNYLYDDALNAAYLRSGDLPWIRADGKATWNPRFAAFGNLTGIEKYKDGLNILQIKADKNQLIEYDANKSLGAGVVGTIPYLLLNSGQNEGKMNGQLKDHRRWAKAVISDLLCRNLPVITTEDALKYVEPNSKISFKSKVQCMQCHATMDNLAGVIRNVEIYSSFAKDFTQISVKGVYQNPIHAGSENYYEQPTNGLIVFRDLHNKLEETPLSNLNDLGKWLTTKDEFYSCAAKRYFQFLTGHDVSLTDQSEMQQFVLKEGEKLAQHQSLKKLTLEIIASPYY